MLGLLQFTSECLADTVASELCWKAVPQGIFVLHLAFHTWGGSGQPVCPTCSPHVCDTLIIPPCVKFSIGLLGLLNQCFKNLLEVTQPFRGKLVFTAIVLA